MRSLIVIPRFYNVFGANYDFPVGLGYILASLKAAGHETFVLNLNQDPAPVAELVEQALLEYRPAALLTGGLSPHFPRIKPILETAKRISPSVTTICGGGIITAEPELMMEHLPLDIGVIGEGEATVAELAAALDSGSPLSGVDGVIYRDDSGKPMRSTARAAIKDIDSIPMPDYASLDLPAYFRSQAQNDGLIFNYTEQPRMVPLVGSRSCPYKCTFCFHPLGHKYRQRSIDSLMAESTLLVEQYGANFLMIQDELFSTRTNKERLVEFCDRVRSLGVKWGTSLRADSVDRDILAMCKASGCVFLSYGVESASNEILRSLKKKTTIEEIENALEATYDSKICLVGNIIFGDRRETPQTIQESVDWWLSHRKYLLRVSYIAPYPGSELYRHALQTGVIPDKAWLIPQYHSMRLNMTGMTHDEFFGLADRWAAHSYREVLIPAEITHVEETGTDPVKGPLYTLEAVCPHCGCQPAWTRLNQPWFSISFGHLTMACRECGQKFHTLPLPQELAIQNLLVRLGGKPFAVLHQEQEFNFPARISTRLMRAATAVVSETPDTQVPAYLAERGHDRFTAAGALAGMGVRDVAVPLENGVEPALPVIRRLSSLGLRVHPLICFPESRHAMATIKKAYGEARLAQARRYLAVARKQFPISEEMDLLSVRLGDAARAEQGYRDMTARWPEYDAGYLALARLFVAQGRLEEADRLLRLALVRLPGNQALAGLAREALAAQGAGRPAAVQAGTA